MTIVNNTTMLLKPHAIGFLSISQRTNSHFTAKNNMNQ
jgi:hypothetical protein